MKLQGTVNIRAPRQKVWGFITNPEAVAKCAPGVESMEVVVPDQKFKVVASVGFGTVKVKFNTDVELAGLQAPERGTIKARGSGQGNTVTATADFTLTEATDKTTDLSWNADVNIVGSIAGMANRLMGSVAQNLSGKFFECMKGQVEVAEGVVEAPPPPPSGFFQRAIAAIKAFFARLFGSGSPPSQ
jgi:carbon monoxide dehydrogenase subunit G